MKKLTVFGKNKDWNKELEIFHEDYDAPYGFNCKIIYIDSYRIKEETRHNCTEFHHRFDIKFNDEIDPNMRKHSSWEQPMDRELTDNSAFESDIHSTGGTKRLSYVQSIEITIADKLNDSY